MSSRQAAGEARLAGTVAALSQGQAEVQVRRGKGVRAGCTSATTCGPELPLTLQSWRLSSVIAL